MDKERMAELEKIEAHGAENGWVAPMTEEGREFFAYFRSVFKRYNISPSKATRLEYQFVIDRTTELQGQLQVIIVDHADLKKDSFREFIRENWWPDDKNLVPIDWYKSE